MSELIENLNNLSYEQKTEQLDLILTKLDNSSIPIDELAVNVKTGANLIKELSKKLQNVETEIMDVFKEIEESR
jgi:exodeoxyribonuclease VII small subunit